MGLDIAVYEVLPVGFDFRAGSYSGFGNWRRVLAKSVGMDLDAMYGFGGKEQIEWTGEETYAELLNHSDCEEQLSHWECVELIKDFTPENREAFIKALEESTIHDVVWSLDRWDKWKEAIRHCAENDGHYIQFH